MLEGWVSACPPGEFEPQAALVLGFNELLPFCPQVLVEVVEAVVDRIAIIGIVRDEEQRRSALTLLCDWGLPAHLIHFASMPVVGMWVRDYGPAFVRWSDGRPVILDAEYAIIERRNDDVMPQAMGALMRLNVIRVPLALEGGNLLGNGEGLCITTAAILHHNAHHAYSIETVRDIIDHYYGYFHSVTLHGLRGEVSGHADLFCTFVSPTQVVVGAYDPAEDPDNARRLDENARILDGVPTRSGKLRVTRIPMPPHRDGIWRTYTNVIFANRKLLVPVYPDVCPDLDERALGIYRDLLPGWEVVGIDATGVIQQGGALHCMSIHIPWLEERFPLSPPVRKSRRIPFQKLMAI